MELKVVIDKKFAFIILGGILILAGAIYGYAYGGSTPTTMGHSWGEIGNIPADLADGDDYEADTRCDSLGQCSKVCIGSDCQTSWPEGGISQVTTVSGSSCTAPRGGKCQTSATCPTGYYLTGFSVDNENGFSSKYGCSYRLKSSTSTKIIFEIERHSSGSTGICTGRAHARCSK